MRPGDEIRRLRLRAQKLEAVLMEIYEGDAPTDPNELAAWIRGIIEEALEIPRLGDPEP